MASSIADNIKVIRDSLESDRPKDPLMVAVSEAGLNLLQEFLVNVSRIADAAEALAKRN